MYVYIYTYIYIYLTPPISNIGPLESGTGSSSLRNASDLKTRGHAKTRNQKNNAPGANDQHQKQTCVFLLVVGVLLLPSSLASSILEIGGSGSIFGGAWGPYLDLLRLLHERLRDSDDKPAVLENSERLKNSDGFRGPDVLKGAEKS